MSIDKKLDNQGNNAIRNLDVKTVAERVIDYKEKLELLKKEKKLDDNDKLLIKQAREFAEAIKTKTGAEELYKRQSNELLDLLSQISDKRTEIIKPAKQSQNELVKEVVIEEEKKAKTFEDEYTAITNFLGNKEYFKDINIFSAISVINKVTRNNENSPSNWHYESYGFNGQTGQSNFFSHKDFLINGYKSDGFFGPIELSNLNLFKKDYDSNPDLKQKVDTLLKWKNKGYDLLKVVNSISTIEKNGETKVLESICDLNGNGEVDTSDNGLISGKDVFDLINKNTKEEEKIIKNMSEITGVEFHDKSSLFNALKSDPTLKYDLFSRLYFLAMSGVNLKSVLIKGKSGISKSIENMGQNLLLLNELTETLTQGFEKKYDEAVLALEKKLEDQNLSIEDRNKLIELISIYKGTNKQKFIDSFKMNSTGLLINLVQNNKGIGVGGALTNTKIDNFLKENTSKLINGMQLNLGFTIASGSLTPGVGVNFSSRDFEISENTKLNFNGGLFLTIPYLMGTLNYNYNTDSIKDAGFANFSESSKNIGITLNASTVSNGITLHWSKDKLEAVEKKEKNFKALLDDLFAGDFDTVKAINNLNNSDKLSEEDKRYIKQFIEKINNTLNLIGYNKLNTKHKELAIYGVKYALLNEWKTGLFMQAQKDGIEFSGAGVGLQFIAGFLPIITAGIRFTDYKLSFTKDRQAEAIQNITDGESGIQKVVVTESTKIDGDKIVEGLKSFKNDELDKYLTENQDRIVGLAQRHIKDYPKFLKKLTSGDYPNALIYLQKILKTDPIIKNDEYIKNLLKSINSFNDIQKAYILSQFMDSIFKDKNSISQVLSTNTLWNDREKGLKGVYNEGEIYSQVISLRNKVRTSVGTHPIPTAEKGIIGFVASYKIRWTSDGSKKSLGKGEAVIPPGLATVVGGPNGIEKITDSKLVDHTISNLEKTPFYEKLNSSLEKIISAKYNDFKFKKGEFESFLKTGELKVGEKTIMLDRDFVFFLYGKCANETLGLKINGINLGDGKIQKLEFNPTGEIGPQIAPNIPVLETENYSIGILGGGEKSTNPSTEKQTNTPTTIPTDAPTTAPPTTNTSNNGNGFLNDFL